MRACEISVARENWRKNEAIAVFHKRSNSQKSSNLKQEELRASRGHMAYPGESVLKKRYKKIIFVVRIGHKTLKYVKYY